jgi:hypothetical protein
MMDLSATSQEVKQFNDLSMQLMQAALDITGMEEVDDETLAVLRKVRSTCAVLLSALQQVAAIQTAGFTAIPPSAM